MSLERLAVQLRLWREIRILRRRKKGRQPDARRREYRPRLEGLELRLAPAISLAISQPAPFPEGDSGTSLGMFVVTRSGDLVPSVSVDFATQDGTAKAGTDYTAMSGTLTFAPNQTTATIGVPIIGNTLFQSNRTFTVNLTNPVVLSEFAAP